MPVGKGAYKLRIFENKPPPRILADLNLVFWYEIAICIILCAR